MCVFLEGLCSLCAAYLTTLQGTSQTCMLSKILGFRQIQAAIFSVFTSCYESLWLCWLIECCFLFSLLRCSKIAYSDQGVASYKHVITLLLDHIRLWDQYFVVICKQLLTNWEIFGESKENLMEFWKGRK